jgi:hypothetical protein
MEKEFEKVRELEERLLRPEVRTSVAELDALVAAEFLEVTSTGSFYGKQHVIDDLPHAPVVERLLSEFKALSLAPDVILTTYLLTKPKEPGAPKSRRSSIWKKIDDRWQMVFHQGTNIK